MHHQRLSSLQACPMPQGDMGRTKHHWESGAILPGHCRRHLHAAVAVRDNLLGIATVRRHGDHSIPDFQLFHSCPQFQHLARDFKAGAERRLWLLLILSAGDQAIGEIDATGLHKDTHLAGTGPRLRDILQPQGSWPGEFMADDGSHGCESSIVEQKTVLRPAGRGRRLVYPF